MLQWRILSECLNEQELIYNKKCAQQYTSFSVTFWQQQVHYCLFQKCLGQPGKSSSHVGGQGLLCYMVLLEIILY